MWFPYVITYWHVYDNRAKTYVNIIYGSHIQNITKLTCVHHMCTSHTKITYEHHIRTSPSSHVNIKYIVYTVRMLCSHVDIKCQHHIETLSSYTPSVCYVHMSTSNVNITYKHFHRIYRPYVMFTCQPSHANITYKHPQFTCEHHILTPHTNITYQHHITTSHKNIA